MATRIVEWKKPYTWWKAISIDEDKVISLNLRDENNLIIYDEGDDEIYVDLQLPDWITPTDAFPVWVTTGRAVVADWWDLAGTIICAKTTSGDNIKLLYADDWTLWIDNWTWTFKQIYFKSDVDALLLALRNYVDDELALKQDSLTAWAGISIVNNEISNTGVLSVNGNTWAVTIDEPNTKTFYLSGRSDLTNAQAAYDWFRAWKNPIIVLWGEEFLCYWDDRAPNPPRIKFVKSKLEFDQYTWYWTISIRWVGLTYSFSDETTVTNIANLQLQYSSVITSETVVSDDSWVTYHITVSNSDPTSWTASNIITLVP